MSDIIELLPDSVANQIAAGEVVQRPASVIKELMENAIDSGASQIQLIIKNAGKTLIQVVDNGCGMSSTDARMSFERHATSKIKGVNDLFSLHTKGFRGEALASIAAIAHVELKTKKTDDELGTHLVIEGSKVKTQEPIQCSTGSSFAVKNLFYNVPARRNFLKSNPVETRHIIEEFQRVALVHPETAFSLYHDEREIFKLSSNSLRLRIVDVFGKKCNQKLVPIEEATDWIKISGFIGKPEFSKKTKGEQYFFVNQRFIKSGYLHHAVTSAYQELISTDMYASYFIYFDIDPAKIDINIHPTKTEVKFEDEKSLYAILRAAVKQSLGKYNISPTLDFEQETSFNVPPLKKGEIPPVPTPTLNPNYNPFKSEQQPSLSTLTGFKKQDVSNWEDLLEVSNTVVDDEPKQQVISADWEEETTSQHRLMHSFHGGYILTQIKSGLIVVDQQRAHQRILFEKFINQMQEQTGKSQQLLFPVTVQFSPSDKELLNEMNPVLKQIGFELEISGRSTIVINGVPPECVDLSVEQVLEELLEQYKNEVYTLKNSAIKKLAHSLAYALRMKENKLLGKAEITHLIDELFACENPYHTPSGKPTIITLTQEELQKRFQ